MTIDTHNNTNLNERIAILFDGYSCHYQEKNIENLLIELSELPINNATICQELLLNYITIIDNENSSLTKLLGCLDQLYYSFTLLKDSILIEMIRQGLLSDNSIETIEQSLSYVHNNKKQIIIVFNSSSDNYKESDFYLNLLLILNENYTGADCQKALSLLNYQGNSTILREFPELLESTYLIIFMLMNELYDYIGSEKGIIDIIAKIIISNDDNLQLFESTVINHLLQVDINIIRESITSNLVRKILYEGHYKIIKENTCKTLLSVVLKKGNPNLKRKCNVSEHVRSALKNCFSELHSNPDRFGITKFSEVNIPHRKRYLDRRSSWEIASNIIAYLLGTYGAITPLTLTASQFLEFIVFANTADKDFDINMKYDNSVTPLSIIAHSTECRFLSLYYCEQDETFSNNLQSLFTLNDLIELLPDPHQLKDTQLLNQTMGLIMAPIERIVDRLILLRNTSDAYMNQMVNKIIKILIDEYCEDNSQSIANILNCIRLIITHVNHYRYDYKLKECKKALLASDLKQILQNKIKKVDNNDPDYLALHHLLNEISLE